MMGSETQCDSACDSAMCDNPTDFVKPECRQCAQCEMMGAARFVATCHQSCDDDVGCLATCAGVTDEHLRNGDYAVPPRPPFPPASCARAVWMAWSWSLCGIVESRARDSQC